MNTLRQAILAGVIAGALAFTAAHASGPAAAKASGLAAADAAASDSSTLPPFTPPPDSAIPDDPFGAMVRRGRDIFTNTQKYAKQYVGNGLNCQNCHLDAGRRANSGPLWAAYVRYPRYLSKNDAVNTYAERLQGCFEYSMNGKPPPADSEIIKALTTYSYWLATGAPTGKDLAGFDYPKQGFASPEAPGYERGRKVYEKDCALCHGNDGQGQKVAGAYVFPPLWGTESFNWGAGMQQLDMAAAFIKANMPLSLGGTLDDQDAWDVAYYMDAHERPQDPRFTGDVAQTRKRYHDSKWSLYGKEINGHVLGSGGAGSGR
jgi:thiosulfate dehydrogenase